MDMTMNPELVTLAQKIKTKSPVTMREVALTIVNDEETLLKYIADNDPVQAYRLLHESDAPMVVGVNANFVPNTNRVEGEFKLLLVKKDFKTINQVVSKFVINMKAKNYTTNSQLLKAMEDMKAIRSTNDGYMFNLILS